jgi:hypothetical protein
MATNGDVTTPNALTRQSTAQGIWDKRVMGYSVFEISHETGLSIEKVHELLDSYHRSIKTEAIEFHRAIALARVESLIKTYLPVALMDRVVVERMRGGESVFEEDIDYPLRCACLVLACLKFAGELLNLRALPEPVGGANQLSILSWLQMQREFIQKAAAQTPPDTLELPTQQLDSRENPRVKPGPDKSEAAAATNTMQFSEIEFVETPIERQDSRAPSQEDTWRARAEQNRAERASLFERDGFDAL